MKEKLSVAKKRKKSTKLSRIPAGTLPKIGFLQRPRRDFSRMRWKAKKRKGQCDAMTAGNLVGFLRLPVTILSASWQRLRNNAWAL